ncbi:DNA polymerase III subunit delta [Kordiimonas sediminis]|uniref:DNA polymerase III subunit delta n=1 Tax=Kordiimonas sediminis TaxID=1735581 RepID=A0A919E5K1_9PROT|nr:DNA polymerase III subunit delta [Kordiimonas sediminis]GHF15291.1 DNA polymerase III subunit delta [Kordiimonas sediminis]
MVALKPRDIPATLKKLDPSVRAVLVYGRDEGLVRERAHLIAKQVAPDLSDPFQVAKPDMSDIRDTPGILSDEVSAISMMGGRRLVLVQGTTKDATDSSRLAEGFSLTLDNAMGDGLLIVMGGDLKPTSALRKAAEKAKNAVAIPCYEDDEQGLFGLIQEVLGGAGLTPTKDAMSYLVANLGSNRIVSRGELEKLALYKRGSDSQVTVEDAMNCVGDTAALNIGSISEAVTAGRIADLETYYERALTAGESTIAILRIVQNRLLRMHLVHGLVADGVPQDQAIKRSGPMIFFKDMPKFQDDLRRWTPARIDRGLEILLDAELDCKTTGNPDTIICGRALLSLAKAARSSGTRR